MVVSGSRCYTATRLADVHVGFQEIVAIIVVLVNRSLNLFKHSASV